MSSVEILQVLQEKFGQVVCLVQEGPDPVLEAPAGLLVEVARSLKEELGFNFLLFVTAVDRGEHLELAYGLRSLSQARDMILKGRLPSHSPVADSFTSLWPAADWDEREVYDLFGVEFKGHPYLRRILLPDDWEGHPLLKSYPLAGRPARIPD